MTRRRTLTVTALAVLGIAAASAVDWPVKLIWNATASAPIGFYTVEPAERSRSGPMRKASAATSGARRPTETTPRKSTAGDFPWQK